MDHKKERKLQAEVIEELEVLEKLFTDRIAELHEVKGGQADRHAFIFYREKLTCISRKCKTA